MTKQVLFVVGCCVFAALALAVIVAGDRHSVRAEPPGASSTRTVGTAGDERGRDADREAIRSTSGEFMIAFGKADAKAVAAGWTERGEYYDDQGVALRGRAAIEAAYVEFFKAHHKCTLEIDIQSIRFPSRDTAIEEGVLRLAQSGPELPTSSRYSVLHVREDGQWKVALCREWASDQDKLEDLAWLVGSWSSNSKDVEVRMQFEWNETRTLMQLRFSVREGGVVISSGLQTISEDPQSGRLRSTTVDDKGGRGESYWHRDGNRWVLNSIGTLRSGAETNSTDIITRIDNETIVWRSTDRTIDANEALDAPPVQVSRVKSGR